MSKSIQIPGSQLTKEDQSYVLAAYVHRFTKEHKPQWACEPLPDGTAYPVQFANDQDWLWNTLFYVSAKTFRLDHRAGRCESTPTWPDNPELRNK